MSWNIDMSDHRYDVIVVAAGFGGASGAGLPAKRGLGVPLLNENNVAAGTGIGTRQAIMPVFNVADAMEKRHGTRVPT